MEVGWGGGVREGWGWRCEEGGEGEVRVDAGKLFIYSS